jgi:hypothetical protein
MIIEGKILHVMESWPLQLIVEAREGKFQVALQSDTKVMRRNDTVDPKQLLPGLDVTIEGSIPDEAKLAITANSIEIVD